MPYSSLRLLVGVLLIGLAVGTTINLKIRKWYYVAQTDVGTPSQVLYLAFDVGSRDLWMYGGMCYQISTKCTKGTLQYFRGHQSSTYQTGSGTLKLNFTTTYSSGNGSVTMVSARDIITVDTISLGATNFGESKLADYSYYKTLNASGIFGLGLASNTKLTGFYSGLTNGAGSFTLKTNNNAQTATITSGVDSTCVTPYHYIALSSTTLSVGNKWEIPIEGYTLGTSVGSTLSGYTATFTTLNKNIQIPMALYKPIHAELVRLFYDFSWNHDLVDCKRRAQLPTLTLNFGGRNYNVTPYEYITQTPTNYCILRLVPNYNSNQWILGYPFHQGHCENFDANGLRVGLSTPQS